MKQNNQQHKTIRRIFLYVPAIIISAFLLHTYNGGGGVSADRSGEKQMATNFTNYLEQKKINFNKTIDSMVGCREVKITYAGQTCTANEKGILENCEKGFDKNFIETPVCIDYGVIHLKTPDAVKAIYMSSYVAGNKNFREKLFSAIDNTELNTVMIDVKEVDGLLTSPEFAGIRPETKVENRIPDLRKLLDELAQRNIYTIARIVVFKDKDMVEKNPDWAVKKKSASDVAWADYGGKKYIDPGAQDAWDYIVDLAKKSYAIGFDEINLDYIRFPSDGNMADAYYPHSQEMIDADPIMGRSNVLSEFHQYFHDQLRGTYPDIVTSADVFGMVATNRDDLTIGQILEPYLDQYDYVAPMVYPSHYPKGFLGLQGHPDNYPYRVVNYSMQVAADRARAQGGEEYVQKLRPWLQDFTCTWCAGYFPYGGAELRAQINATYDAGLDSWMLWDAGNTYSYSGLLKK